MAFNNYSSSQQYPSSTYPSAWGGSMVGASGQGGGGGAGTIIGANMPRQPDELDQELDERAKEIHAKDLDFGEAESVLTKVLKTNIVPFLWGPPGVGKSTLVRDICATKKWRMIDLRLSLLNPVDLRGLPVVNREAHVAEWFSPSFLPKEGDKPGLLFLDEINLAPLSVQAAAYQLILDKRLGEYVFPSNWKIIAAGNRETDRANVFKISAPLANRFVHFEIRPDIRSWKKWALKNVRSEVSDFMFLRPESLFAMPKEAEKAFPTPRSWAFVSQLLDAFDFQGVEEDEGVIDPELASMIIGAVGEVHGKTFCAYLATCKMREITGIIEKFSKTGKIVMPKGQSLRYQTIVAVLEAFLDKQIPEKHYDTFIQSISGEERASIAKFKQENSHVFNENSRSIEPNKKQRSTLLLDKLAADGDEMLVEDFDIISKKKTVLLFNTKGDVEIIRYKTSKTSPDGAHTMLVDLERGLESTDPRVWPAGTLVQQITL